MKRKIFHIIPSLMSGGAERLLTDVVSKTSAERFSHTICILGRADFFAPEIRRNGSEVIELNLFGKHPWLAAARKIIPIIQRRQPDLIVSWLYDASIVSRLAVMRYRKIPLVNTLHSPDYDPETIKAGNWSSRNSKGLQIIDKISTKIANPYFTACSHFVAESYKRNLNVNPSRIRVIYNFITLESLVSEKTAPEQLKKSLGIPADGFVYINIGRLDPQKGQIYLLKAFQKVLADVPNAHLIVVGTGHLENSYKKLAESLKIAHRTYFLGNRKDIGVCLEAADVFVFPSLFEGLGIAIIEAMAKGLPCIASRLEVLREIIDDGISGLLVAPESETELAQAMVKVYRQPELREKLGKEAFETAHNQFLSRILIPEWEKLFTDVPAYFS